VVEECELHRRQGDRVAVDGDLLSVGRERQRADREVRRAPCARRASGPTKDGADVLAIVVIATVLVWVLLPR